MHKTVKLNRDFHKFLAALRLLTQHYSRRQSSNARPAPLPRQWRARGTAADSTGHGSRAREFQRDRPLRVPNGGTGVPGVETCLGASEFNRRQRAARSTTPSGRDRRWTSNVGAGNTSCDEFPDVTESILLRSPLLSAEPDLTGEERT